MAGSKQDFPTALNCNTVSGAPFAEPNGNSLASSGPVASSVDVSSRFGRNATGAIGKGAPWEDLMDSAPTIPGSSCLPDTNLCVFKEMGWDIPAVGRLDLALTGMNQ